ncbi:MAG: glycosyltransferase family 4 protein [Candidatus Saliniplasma sp.]
MFKNNEKKRKPLLRVLFVTESYPPSTYGGGEISCSLLAEGIAKREGVHVTVLTSKVEGLDHTYEKNGVRILRRLKTGGNRSTFKGNIKRRLFFKRSVKKELGKIIDNYDLVHFFNITSIVDVQKPSFATINSYVNFCPKGNLFYKGERVCRGCAPIKFTGCITNSEYVGGYELTSLLKYNPVFWLTIYLDYLKRKKSLKNVDHFFSLSEFINKLLIKEGISPQNITKVVNMPDIEKSNRKMDLPKKGVNISYIGQLGKIKGVDLLIRAFNKPDTDAKLIIVGDGPERDELEKMAKSNSNIIFLGKVEHESIHSVYEQSDVIVVPSVWPEPLSRVLLESAYFGKPVIATKVGGSPEIIEHRYNGLLTKTTVNDLAEKIRFIVDRDEMRETMGRNMKVYYEKKLSREKILDKIIKTYKDHLGYLGQDMGG